MPKHKASRTRTLSGKEKNPVRFTDWDDKTIQYLDEEDPPEVPIEPPPLPTYDTLVQQISTATTVEQIHKARTAFTEADLPAKERAAVGEMLLIQERLTGAASATTAVPVEQEEAFRQRLLDWE